MIFEEPEKTVTESVTRLRHKSTETRHTVEWHAEHTYHSKSVYDPLVLDRRTLELRMTSNGKIEFKHQCEVVPNKASFQERIGRFQAEAQAEIDSQMKQNKI